MTESLNDAVFSFPVRQNSFMNGEKPKRNDMDRVDSELLLLSHRFPDEFPYDLDSPDSFAPSLCSPVESLQGSTESESSEDDEDEFLAQLTRRLTQSTQKLAVPSLNRDKSVKSCMASSPQSTLGGLESWSASGNGSPNGPSQVPSPPTTPFGGQNDTWDLIYAAAGQVARLKMSHESPNYKNANSCLFQTHSLVKNPSSGFPSRQSSAYNNLPQTNQLHHQQVKREQRFRTTNWQMQNGERSFGSENGRCGLPSGPRGPPHSSWPALPVQTQNRQAQPGMRALFLAGSGGVKRESAGTGVFLPRRYGNPPEFRKKPGCSTVLLPAKVVQALNLNLEEINGHSQANYSSNLASGYDGLMTRRNVAVTQSKRNYRPEEILQQDWTY